MCKLLASAWFLLDAQHRDGEGVRVPGEEMAAPAGRRSCLWLRLAGTRSSPCSSSPTASAPGARTPLHRGTGAERAGRWEAGLKAGRAWLQVGGASPAPAPGRCRHQGCRHS